MEINNNSSNTPISSSGNSFVQAAIESQIKNKDKKEKEELPFNLLGLYFRDDLIINEQLSIRQPTIQDFINYGENNIYAVIAPFVSNTTGYRVQLWDMGYDWNKVTNQELFATLIKNINPEYSKLIFGDFDFRTFVLAKKTYNETGKTEIVLYSKIYDMEINEELRNKICLYIQYMFNIFPPKQEFTKSKQLKIDLINNDKLKQIADSDKKSDSRILPMISFCLNHPGFKYKKENLRRLGIFQFMDSVQRLLIYESTHALFSGMYSGFVDTKKINKKEFDFMRDIKNKNA